ncbi:unnamed protein product [Knipowitschia caucasica]
METFVGETEESTEDSSGRKKSKLKSFKSRFFGKSKKGGGSSRKLSQSASDIAAEEALGSDENLADCNPGAMGSRAFSHDSIFLADQALTESEPTRVVSQENVHVKIKALQEKLQQQKFHLGPPPTIPPVKRSEDQTKQPEVEHTRGQEMTEQYAVTQENLNKELLQISSNPTPPCTKPAPMTSPPKASSPIEEASLDLCSPVQFTSLDTSAARHRLSVKPRNQRASSKRRHTAVDSTAQISDLIISDTLAEEKERTEFQENVNTAVSKPETPLKASSFVSPQKDEPILGKIPTVSTQILRPKAPKPADAPLRPHSSFIPSESKGKSHSSEQFDINLFKDTQNKAGNVKAQTTPSEQLSLSPGVILRAKVELDKTSAIKRPLPGSGSFHLSASKRREEEDRPRSGSFTGVREHWMKTEEKRLGTGSNIEPKVDVKPDGVALMVGRGETWMIKDKLRKVELVREVQSKVTDTGDHAAAVKEEDKEEATTTFGVKLRSTSQSVRLRPETTSNECLKSAVMEEEQLKQDSSDTGPVSSKASPADTAQEVSTAPAPVTTPQVSAEAPPSQVKGVSERPQPHATSTSWMSMAKEKTRSLQNLFTSKLPKEFNGGISAACSTTQTPNIEPQIQETKSMNEPVSKTEEQKAPAQQNTAQLTKVSQTASTESVKGNIWTSQSPLRSVRQQESTAQSNTVLSSSPGSPQSPLWTTRSLRSTGVAFTQDTTSASKTSTTPAEETEGGSVWGGSVSKKASFLEKRAEWTTSSEEMKSEAVGKEAKSEFKHTVSKPKNIVEAPKEENWIKRPAAASSAPSLHSLSESRELSWIELAKRKSMAWSDKSMD